MTVKRPYKTRLDTPPVWGIIEPVSVNQNLAHESVYESDAVVASRAWITTFGNALDS
jgi:hypothetical protein